MASIREIVRASVAEILAENGRPQAFSDNSSLVGSAMLSSMDLLGVMVAIETAGVNVSGVSLEKIDNVEDIIRQLGKKGISRMDNS